MSDLVELHLQHCRRRGLAARTIDERRKLLSRMHRELPLGLEAATEAELAAWLDREDWAAPTKACYTAHVVQFFRWAAGRHLDYDPSLDLPRIRVEQGLPHPASLDELDTVLTELRDPWRTAVILAAYQGLRCCEMAPLLREHVTEETLTIMRGKGGRPAILPTHPTVWATVRDMPPGHVIRRRLRPPTAHWLSSKLARELDEIGMPHLTAHWFRHTFGTAIYRATKDVRLTQELLRHRSVNTTMIYTHISGEERRAGIRTLPTVPAAASL